MGKFVNFGKKLQILHQNRAIRLRQKRVRDSQYKQAQGFARMIPGILARQGGATIATNNKRKVVMNKFKIEKILIHDDYYMFKLDMYHTPWGKGVAILKDENVLETMALAMNRQVRTFYRAGEGFYYMIPRRDGLSDIPVSISLDEVLKLLPAMDRPGHKDLRHYWTTPLGVGENKRVYKIDIRKTPHLLILGTTGSGKTVFIKNLLLSLAMKNGPRRMRMVICDFKRGPDYRAFNRLPQLGAPSSVRTTTNSDINAAGELIEKKTPDYMNRILYNLDEITAVLHWAAAEIDRRNRQFDESVTDINRWNKVHQREYMSHIFIVVDELAIIIDELSRNKASDLHRAIGRIARLGRSAGVHLVLGIQNLETKYLSGGISNNISTRIVGRFASGAQSGTAIGTGSWAAINLPNVDGRVIWRNDSKLHEIQTPWIEPRTIPKMIDAIAEQWRANDGEQLGAAALTVFRWALENQNGELPVRETTAGLTGTVSSRTVSAILREYEGEVIEVDGEKYRLVARDQKTKAPRRLIKLNEGGNDGTVQEINQDTTAESGAENAQTSRQTAKTGQKTP